MLTQQLIDKIREQINALYEQAMAIDQRNSQIKSSRFKYRDFFNSRLFRCDSILLTDYVRETEQNLNDLLRVGRKSHLMVGGRGEQLTDQISALSRAIRANEVAIREHNFSNLSNKKRFAKYKKSAGHIMANSHQLHQELAKNHDYERRLNEMIFDRQSRIANVDLQIAAQLQREVLALHQRLGKCRRAITIVEEKIQFVDSKN